MRKQTLVVQVINWKLVYKLSNEYGSFQTNCHCRKCAFSTSVAWDSVIPHHKTPSRFPRKSKLTLCIDRRLWGWPLLLSCNRTWSINNYHSRSFISRSFEPPTSSWRMEFSSNSRAINSQCFDHCNYRQRPDCETLTHSFLWLSWTNELLVTHVPRCGSALVYGSCLGSIREFVILHGGD